MKRGDTRDNATARTIAEYRKYIRMELPKSALALLEAHPNILGDIDPHSVLRDAEKGIK